jgi:deoxycytidine triphosphate deaminase
MNILENINKNSYLNYEDNLDSINDFYESNRFDFYPGEANGDEIKGFLDAGFINEANEERISGTSLDLELQEDFKVLKGNEIIDLTKGEKPSYVEMKKHYGKYWIHPNLFFITSTKCVFNLPNWLKCQVFLRSSIGRAGVNHMLAGLVDPGFNGSNLTLEFKNETTNTYLVDKDCYFIQIVFHKIIPVSSKYDYTNTGRHNNELGTVGCKGVV